MVNPDSFDIVVNAIAKKWHGDLNTNQVSLCHAKKSELLKIQTDELFKILQSLEYKEKILKIIKFKSPDENNLNDVGQTITLELLPGFKKWLSDYSAQKAVAPEKLSILNFDKVFCMALDIKEKLELKSINIIEIDYSFLNNSNFVNSDYKEILSDIESREEALQYLQNRGVIFYYESVETYDFGEEKPSIILDIELATYEIQYFKINVNVTKFMHFLNDLITIYERKKDEIVYEISFTNAGEIVLINKLRGVTTKLGKPQFGSNNYFIFNYLYQHPDTKLSRGELAKELGEDIGEIVWEKDFDKMLENLRIKGSLRRAFFRISKQDILFRRTVTKRMCDELNLYDLSY